MESEDRWKTLGKTAKTRRMALGYRYQPSFVEKSGIGKRTLSAIETGNLRGRKDFDPPTRYALETTLLWAPGSIDRILAGGEPIELPAPAPEGSPLSKLGPTELVAQINERLAALVRLVPDQRIEGYDPGGRPNLREPMGKYVPDEQRKEG